MQIDLMTWIASGLASLVLCFVAFEVLRRANIIDRPNERSSHTRPTVRGGGVAIILTVVAGGVLLAVKTGAVLLIGVAAAAVVLAVISFIDDIRTLSARYRFGAHAGTALAALLLLGWPAMEIRPGLDIVVHLAVWASIPILFLWLTGYTNAFNFMDGINGLASGQAVVTGFGTALVLIAGTGEWTSPPILFSLVISGAALGFVPHNFPKARMFMGDVSSAPLGFLLAFVPVWAAILHGWHLFLPMVMLHANFVLDTGITLGRRVFRGEKWYDAHREHFYQRLIRSGKSHPYVTGLEMSLQWVVVVLMVGAAQAETMRVSLLVCVVLIWASFFGFAEITFRRAKRAGI